jgi:hypothetical protein
MLPAAYFAPNTGQHVVPQIAMISPVVLEPQSRNAENLGSPISQMKRENKRNIGCHPCELPIFWW